MNTDTIAAIHSVTLEVADPAAAASFYRTAFGIDDRLRFVASTAPSTGFRGCVLSLVVAEPAVVDSLFEPALAAGAEQVKPAKKSFWGYGGVLRAPDGTLWKIAAGSKKDTGAPPRVIDDVVLLLGVADVAVTKAFYTGRGLTVAKSFGRKYVEFDAAPGAVKLALYGRKFAAKDAGVEPAGEGSHRIRIGADLGGSTGGSDGGFTDPDGFVWA